MQGLPSKACFHSTCVLVHNWISQMLHGSPSAQLHITLKILASGLGIWDGHAVAASSTSSRSCPQLPSRHLGQKQLIWTMLTAYSKGCLLPFIFCFSPGSFLFLAYFSVLEVLSTSSNPLWCWFRQKTQNSRSSGTTDGLDHLPMSPTSLPKQKYVLLK